MAFGCSFSIKARFVFFSTFPFFPQLRYLQTLSSIAAEHNSTIIFPMPMNILDHFMGGKKSDELEMTRTPAAITTVASAE